MKLIKGKYDKKEQEQRNKKKEAYKEQAQDIEKQLTKLIVQMIDDDVEGDAHQGSILLRHALKKLQTALRFLR